MKPSSPIKIVCITGLILTLVFAWGLVLSHISWGNPGREKAVESTFSKSLREYNLLDAPRRITEGDNPEEIERLLARLEKQAGSVEEQLSVLKRRRALALIDRRYTGAYEKAAREAAEKYIHSAPLAAVAAEAIVLAGTPGGDSLALLKDYTARMPQSRFDIFNLSLGVLAGNLDSPATAAAMPGIQSLHSLDLSSFPPSIQRDLLIDDFLLLAYKGDIPAASLAINKLLDSSILGFDPDIISPDIVRMAAEFFYDNQNPRRAAELFLRLNEDRYLARAAESLALAGEIPGARNIWLALSGGNPSIESGSVNFNSPAIQRTYYNLASSSADRREEESWLEKYFSRLPPEDIQNGIQGIYSVIRYSRLLDTAGSIEVLEEFKDKSFLENSFSGSPLLELELLRRRLAGWPLTRAAGETWLLLGRYSDNEDVYKWAAWFFERQKLYSEIDRLFIEASRQGLAGSWLDLHKSLALLRNGKMADAEKLLEEAFARDSKPGNNTPAGNSPDFRISANLGRIHESRRAISAALESYETAAALVKDKQSAAIIQMRISRCLEALGSSYESRKALELAYELDPANINIRREVARRQGE